MTHLEPERYELREGPAYTFDLNRRGLFKLLGGGVIVVSIISDAGAQESGGGRRRGSGPAAPKEIGPGCISAKTARSRSTQAKSRSDRMRVRHCPKWFARSCACP